jgi:MurNAc alpha-1-phosphate uridylyltransferase
VKVLILAAGRGERMRPLTDSVPKPLLEVGGRALIEHHIVRLAAAGFRDLYVNLSWLGELIRERLGDGSRHGVNITWSEEGPEPLETAGAVVALRTALGRAPFIVVNGDIFTDYPFERLALPAGRQAHLVLVPNPAHRPQGDFTLAGERLTYAGIGMFDPGMFDGLAPGKHALGPMLHKGWDAGTISAERHDGVWSDIGTPERLEALRAQLNR